MDCQIGSRFVLHMLYEFEGFVEGNSVRGNTISQSIKHDSVDQQRIGEGAELLL